MASRMDRYYEKPRNPRARSARNEELYKKIQNMDSYSNIEAIETIAKTNEIDITKVREMIKNRENYKKEQQYKKVFNVEQEKPNKEQAKEFYKEEKSYDIMDVLNKAKDNYSEDNSNRSLKNMNYDVIKELNLRKTNYEDSEEELKDLINTITNKDGDDIGLLDNLTSDTMVGEASSIHKILEEEKKQQLKMDTTSEMDKSFFTSAVNFSDKDFEDLKNMSQPIKKSKKWLIVLIIVIALLVTGVVIYLIVR
ncbi:MAG: hypothetical protein IJR82_03155 [Bacilli bacterium]|nr:hypothetical protein [Bacilli bacterium]